VIHFLETAGIFCSAQEVTLKLVFFERKTMLVALFIHKYTTYLFRMFGYQTPIPAYLQKAQDVYNVDTIYPKRPFSIRSAMTHDPQK
jgi:hypothetical protein